MPLDAHFARVPLIPEVSLPDPLDAVPLARALSAGGLSLVELRWHGADTLAAIRAIATQCPQMVVGIGGVIDAATYTHAVEAGARFISSPGSTPSLQAVARSHAGVLYLPGVATISEAMAVREAGFSRVRLGPVPIQGGVAQVATFHQALPDLRFIVSGGVDALNADSFMAQEGVAAIGAGWIATGDHLQRRDWAWIEDNAAAAREALADCRAG